MATSNGANPSRPFAEVRVHVPAAVVHGYPAPPPPPGRSGSTDDLSKPLSFLICLATLCTVVGMFSLLGLLIHASTKMNFPRFRLDSVSVSFHNTTAVWDLGFSIDRVVGDLDVWARFMSRDFKAGSPGSAGNLTVSIKTLLPRGLTAFPVGLVTLEQVVFKCNDYKTNSHRLVIMAACEDVEAVEISSNETAAGEMKMMGGSIWCPIVFKQTYKESVH